MTHMQKTNEQGVISFRRKRKLIMSCCLIVTILQMLFSPVSSQPCLTNEYSYTYTVGTLTSTMCISCPLACATCTNSLICNTCQSTATVISTTTTQKCYCQNGKYYNPATLACETCQKAIPNCNKCSTGLSSTVCTQCNNGFYLYSPTSCAACVPPCKECLDAFTCANNKCVIPQYTETNGVCLCDAGGRCPNCLTSYPNCIDCNNKDCSKKCDIGYKLVSKACVACPTGCMLCGGKCNDCYPGYFIDTANNNACVNCSTFFNDPFCTECISTQCTVCSPGYKLDMTTLICIPDIVPSCLSTEILIGAICIPCLVIFDPFCNTCATSGCLTCVSGYMIDTNVNMCMQIPVCGDGKWIFGYEDCDDKNLINGDGCSSACLVETDYQCLQADQLPSGESLCKYTKDFVVNLMHVIKQESANIAYFYLTFQSSTFQLWTQPQLNLFLSPIEILDSNTPPSNLLPYNSFTISFSIINGQFYFILKVDYGSQNIENAYLKFSMDPSQTTLTQINTKPPQPIVYHLIDSRTNAVNLYNYASDIYALQSTVNVLSRVLGYVSFFLLVFGLVSPAGKLIVVEALAVIQLAHFTVFQFDKIPPTFLGLKYLSPSSGINNIDVVTQVEGQSEQKIYRMFGLDSNFFANYNLSFIFFFFIPFLIGLIGFLVCKFTSTKSPKYQEAKERLLTADEKKRLKIIDINNHFTENLRDTVFQRIMFEVSFYGLITGGYLSWVSVFSSLQSPDTIGGITGLTILLLIWMAYSVLYLKVHTEQLYLPPHYTATFQPLNTVILKGFGDFRDVYQQISKHNFYYSYAVEKVYFLFVLERLMVSVMIVFLPDIFTYTSALIAVIYIIFLVTLIVSHVKYQNKKIVSDRKSIFSYLYRNYVLRQSVNFITTILIQFIYMAQALILQDTSAFKDTLSSNSLTTQTIPIVILSLLYANFVFNFFLWIWQLKNSEIIRKIRQMKKFFFSKRDDLPYKYDSDEKAKRKKQFTDTKQKTKEPQTKRSVEEEEKIIEDSMKKYTQQSKYLEPRQSPFLGYKEKYLKPRPIDIENINGESARKINVQMEQITHEKSKKMYHPQDGV